VYLQYLGNQQFVVRIFDAKICQLILLFVRKLLVDDLVYLFFGAVGVSKEDPSHANA
jgi:hypothetical protein